MHRVVAVAAITFWIGLSSVASYGQSPYSGYRMGEAGHSVFTADPGGVPYPAARPDHWVAPPSSPPTSPGWFGIRTTTTAPLLDFQNRQGDKQLILLDSQAEAETTPQILFGAQFRVSALWGRTNSPNQFAYLGRFPPDFVGQTATDVRLLQANQAIVAHAGPWATGYLETLFSDVFTFPTFNQGSFQVRQAYVVVGNSEVTPFYAFAGKKNVSFGDFSTLSPFTQAVPWHYFAPLAEGIGAGWAAGGWNATATALNGSRGIRVSDSAERGHLNNFAANLSYAWQPTDQVRVQVGGGYLHSTIYDGTTAEHINPQVTGPRNGAWDVNGHVQLGGVHLAGEYVQTFEPWPVTAHAVQAYRTELAYDFSSSGAPLWLSASWSEGLQGASGVPWESNAQLILGAKYTFNPCAMLSVEYVRSLGFAPLIDITTVSNPDVIQNSLVIGFVLTI
ncbi:MAG: LbtU family siderophore porin [Planctomycetaceae bacterium]|nr:LbtU family siderophore porin [Planctomycetaceae bacterium]